MKINRTPETVAAGMAFGAVLFLGTAATSAYETAEGYRDTADNASQVQKYGRAQRYAEAAFEREWAADQFRNGAVLAGCMGAVVVGGIASLRRGHQQAVATPARMTPIELTVEAELFSGNDYVAGNQARPLQTV